MNAAGHAVFASDRVAHSFGRKESRCDGLCLQRQFDGQSTGRRDSLGAISPFLRPIFQLAPPFGGETAFAEREKGEAPGNDLETTSAFFLVV
jgi:hypothetical protein